MSIVFLVLSHLPVLHGEFCCLSWLGMSLTTIMLLLFSGSDAFWKVAWWCVINTKGTVKWSEALCQNTNSLYRQRWQHMSPFCQGGCASTKWWLKSRASEKLGICFSWILIILDFMYSEMALWTYCTCFVFCLLKFTFHCSTALKRWFLKCNGSESAYTAQQQV